LGSPDPSRKEDERPESPCPNVDLGSGSPEVDEQRSRCYPHSVRGFRGLWGRPLTPIYRSIRCQKGAFVRSRRNSLLPLLLLSLVSCQAGQDSEIRAEGGPPSDGPASEQAGPSGTSVFSCLQHEPGSFSFTITDFRMKSGELALWLPLDLGGPHKLLSQEEGAPRFHYSGNGVLLRSSGDVATLEVDGQTFEDCRLDQRRSIWEHAKLTGVDFRATGNEPGWYIEIRNDLEARAGKRIRFVSDYGQREVTLHASDPDPEPGLRRTVYRGENGDLHIIVEIMGSTCWDSMSGEEFESTVTVQFQGRTYRGCGRALH